MVMRAWYDVLGLDLGTEQDERGIRESAELVHALIRRENERGISTDKIVLAGFSQGGATALHTALRHAERFLGIVALSTYLPLIDTFDDEADAANNETPIFIGHGTMDPLVPVTLGQKTHAFLAERNYPLAWHTYPIEHAVSPEEIMDLGAWLRDRL
jgi:phospholipase/carboxylesterase